MKTLLTALAFASVLSLSPVQAAIVNIDISGAATGTTINGIGADFTQSFLGQSVSGTSLTGAPTNPLTLQASGTITVASFDPGVSPAGNSLLSQPGNLAPLAVLLDTLADSFDWTMGSASAGSTILASLYDGAGALVGSQSIVMINGYGLYSLSGLGSFRGIAFSNNNDPSGVRFMNMSYNSTAGTVPEPGSLALVALGILAAGAARSRRAA
ncbi:MAG: PEP-CTERM sorting domain-containing protein [Ideonella sp.]|nr:PEP-CTERM sorting domain-containing protein [Ideonella sp.]